MEVWLALALFLATGQHASAAAVTATAPTETALYVVRHLDVLSFPNSMRSRARADAHIPMDYGFVDFKPVGSKGDVGAYANQGSRFFAIRIIHDRGNNKLLCIKDVAVNGCDEATYPLEIRLGPDGLFHATGIVPPSVEDEGCYLEGVVD
jgi:hypothetical protein